LRQLPYLFQGIGEVWPVHHGNAWNVVAETRRIRVLADICALANLLDDVFFDAELGAVEHLDLQAAIRPLLDALRPVLKALVIRLRRRQNVVEAQRVLLCGSLRQRHGHRNRGGDRK
jgi:hypothetical protein